MNKARAKWTAEQEAAMRTRGCNLLVSAAAGAGKTAVLVERIIMRILDQNEPVDVDQLLVVTFTNAAAQEMRERIAQALNQRLRENPFEERLQRQILLLGKAAISTLHSFCLEIIRQNYYRLKLPDGLALDPRFRIADETEGILLKAEVLEELFEEKYGQEDAAFLTLVEGMGGERDDQMLQDLVLKLYSFSRSQVEPAVWLAETAQVFRADVNEEVMQALFRRLAEKIAMAVQEARDLFQEAAALSLQPGGPAAYSVMLEREKQALEEVCALSQSNWQAAFRTLAEFKFAALKACRGEVDESLKEAVQALRNQGKEIIRKLQKEYLARTPAELAADMQQMAPCMECLCTLVQEFSLRYLREKLSRNLIDFDDLEHFALGLLGEHTEQGWLPSQLAQGLRQRFAEVLIDEYQDINAVQEAVLTLVSRSGESGKVPNLFMVGDVKQSIYGFRLAEPGLFLAKYQSYESYHTQSDQTGKTAAEQKIILAKNFRSRKNIVAGVNYVFRQLMGHCLGGIIYDRENELVYGAGVPAASGMPTPPEWPLEVHLLERPSGTEAKTEEEAGLGTQTTVGATASATSSATAGTAVGTGTMAGATASVTAEDEQVAEEYQEGVQAEAHLLGRRILALQKEMVVWDKEQKKYRHPEFRDMVVLLRSVKGSAAVFLEEFRKLGIPAYAETGSGYFAAQEVRVMLALLKVLDNPCQDIPLAAVLLSPVGGFSAEDLARIRLHRQGEGFYSAVCFAARREEEPLQSRLRLFLKKLKQWRTFARRNSLVELIWLLYRETGFYNYAGAMPGGKQRQANLRALLERAKQFEDTTMKGLFKFLRFLGRLESAGSDLGTARALGEKENVVRIMSIHKSKGLEFPIVFLACLGKMFNFQELRGDVLLDRDLGLGPMWVDPVQRLKYPTLAKLVVREKRKAEMLAEEVRILYVAMTRAKEALIMVGTIKDAEKQIKKWEKVLSHQEWELPPALLTQPRTLWDWLGPCLLRHKGGQVLRERVGEVGAVWEETEQDPAPWLLKLWRAEDILGEERQESYDYNEELTCVRQLLPVLSDRKVDGLGCELDSDAVKNAERNVHENPEGKAETDLDTNVDINIDKKLGINSDTVSDLHAEIKATEIIKENDNVTEHLPESVMADSTFAQNKHEVRLASESKDHSYAEEIERILGWCYPYRGLADIPGKLSVTEIKNRYQLLAGNEEAETKQSLFSLHSIMKRPQFLQEQGLSASEKGSALHLVMRQLDLAKVDTPAKVTAQIQELVQKEIITSCEAETVQPAEIVSFIHSPLGQRMRKGKELRREVPFTLALPAEELYPTVAYLVGETIILQGTIDCLFREGEEFVLVDYKTDVLPPYGTEDILRERYRVQLALYARAVAQIFGKPVKEKLLYSFYLQKAILL